jgi:hypothetical protein
MRLQFAGISCCIVTHGFVPNLKTNRIKIKSTYNMNPTNDKKLTALLYQNETRPVVDVVWKDSIHENLAPLCPFKKILAANRGEIAVRICRAATELNVKSSTIYAFEDRNSAHRWDSDESYLLPASGTPVGACELFFSSSVSFCRSYAYVLSPLTSYNIVLLRQISTSKTLSMLPRRMA